MILRILENIRGNSNKPAPADPERQKLCSDGVPDHIYAVGDVHGCEAQFETVLRKIGADAAGRPGSKWLIMLGDYVDRGPGSAAVVDRLINRPPAGIRLFCLAGNHEEVMLDFLLNPSKDHQWLSFGGIATLRSYGIDKLPADRVEIKNLIKAHVPPAHINWLANLPSLFFVPGYSFVHAGVRPGIALAAQRDSDLLWLRPSNASRSQIVEKRVTVHGHTPVGAVEIWPARINIDTGAYMSGLLSAIRISGGEAPVVIDSR